MINLIELYPSIQGETTFVGHPSTFIRLAGCNLRCTWCDTSYAFGRGSPYALADILEQVKSLGLKHVCLTGGEPLLQESIYPLMTLLCEEGFIVSLETGGGVSTEKVDSRVHTILDIKCPGSGMVDKNIWSNLHCLRPHDEVKCVLLDRQDYDFAKEVCKEYALHSKVKTILFSPVFGKLNPQELIGWIIADRLPVRLNLQIHKYVWTPETRGV